MLEPYIRQQLEKKTFPGVSILAAAGDRVLYERCFGLRATWPAPEPLDGGTLFDLASLTKPLVTAFLAAHFIERKQWRLEDEARRFLPALALPVTLGQLLTHSAGLKPWHPFYLYRPLDDLAQVAALAGEATPGTRVVYSDIGYILLKHMLEKVSGAGFRELAARGDLRAAGAWRHLPGRAARDEGALRPHRGRQPLREGDVPAGARRGRRALLLAQRPDPRRGA